MRTPSKEGQDRWEAAEKALAEARNLRGRKRIEALKSAGQHRYDAHKNRLESCCPRCLVLTQAIANKPIFGRRASLQAVLGKMPDSIEPLGTSLRRMSRELIYDDRYQPRPSRQVEKISANLIPLTFLVVTILSFLVLAADANIG